MALWRSGYAAVCKTAYTGSIPVGASRYFETNRQVGIKIPGSKPEMTREPGLGCSERVNYFPQFFRWALSFFIAQS